MCLRSVGLGCAWRPLDMQVWRFVALLHALVGLRAGTPPTCVHASSRCARVCVHLCLRARVRVFLYSCVGIIVSHMHICTMHGQVQHFGAGICAGALASFMTNPFDVVRTRMQLASTACVTSGRSASAWTVAMNIGAHEGWDMLLTRGLLPRVYKKSLAGMPYESFAYHCITTSLAWQDPSPNVLWSFQ